MDRRFTDRNVLRLFATLVLMTALCHALTARAEPTTQVLRGGIAINEFLVDPNSSTQNFDTDNNGAASDNDEFVELYNLSEHSIDLAGLQLWDAGNGNWFTFPTGSVLAAEGYAVVVVGVQSGGALPVVATGSLAFDAGRGSSLINNGGDDIALYDPTADEYLQVIFNGNAADNPTGSYSGFSTTAQRVGVVEDFGSDSDGVSLVRSPAGDSHIVLHNTVAAANASPGTAIGAPSGGGTEVGACGDSATLISAIQGDGDSSPLVNQTVTIEAAVVGNFQGSHALGGFYVEEEPSDQDASVHTSEGLFIAADTPVVKVGDIVRVTGTVTEQYGLTALTQATVGTAPCGTMTIEPTPLELPFDEADNNPEWYEGMRVRLPQELTVTENYNLGRYGEIPVSSSGRLYTPTQVALPGPAALAVAQANAANRLIIDDGGFDQNPDPVIYPDPGLTAENTLRSGYTVSDAVGILDFAFGEYRLQPTQIPQFIASNPRQAAPNLTRTGNLRVASFNVLNYFTTLDEGTAICGPDQNLDCRGANNVSEFTRQRAKILSAIAALDADIVGLIELENNPSASLQDLVDGLNESAGAGAWDYVDTGTLGSDAIKLGLIYKPAFVTPVGAFAILDSSVDPSFIDTKNRPALAQTFLETANGARLTVAVNHFKSKGSACDDIGDPDLGDGQGNCNRTRTDAAIALSHWLATDPTNSGDPDILIMGDLNAYAKEDPITALTDAGYTNLIAQFIGEAAYSYVFSGESGYLDHALASASLLPQVVGVAEWPINADEPHALDYNEEFKSPQQIIDWYSPDAYRSSDHDPVIVELQVDGPAPIDLESAIRELATKISETNPALFVGRFTVLQKARRLALTILANLAAEAVALDKDELARRLLNDLLDRIDGNPEPADWMTASSEQRALADTVRGLIDKLSD
ncbi:MAG: ExeM/NucH family extracellular endonuclease [Gammaproteobacteria bacterium]|nr:ExeM/NucH family extracellular endonuclease [Gammaproteobacteria bacterium]